MAGKGHRPARSIRDLARLVGKAESTVRKWLSRRDWPFSREAPWDVEKVKAWGEIHLKPDAAKAYHDKIQAAEQGSGEFTNMGPLTKVRIQWAIERTLETRQRRLAAAGKLHDTDICMHQRLRKIHAVRNALLDLPRSLAPQLVGQERDRIEAILLERMNNICQEFAAGGGNDTPISAD